ncbi:hypothetical protein BDZ89DRAFT_213778 [Hymenopellis radicata]|nr:hypothetical protein BDZ89DRAFT_213778 [Hymenopellis radicata]
MAPVFKFTWNDKSGLVKPPTNYNLFSQAKKRGEHPWVDLDWSRLSPDDTKYWEAVGTGIGTAFEQAKNAAVRQGLDHATVYWQVPAYTEPELSLGESQPRPAQGKSADHYRERPIAPLPQRRAMPPPSLPASVSTPHADVTKKPSPHTPQKSCQSEPQRKKPRLSPRAQPQVGAQTLPPPPPHFPDRKPSLIYAEWRREHGTASDPPVLYCPSKAYTAWYNRVSDELPRPQDENFFLMGSNLNDEEDEEGNPLTKKGESEASEKQKRLRTKHLLATWDPNVDPALITFS